MSTSLLSQMAYLCTGVFQKCCNVSILHLYQASAVICNLSMLNACDSSAIPILNTSQPLKIIGGKVSLQDFSAVQVITQGTGIITTLTLSLVWIVYSIIPQYLLLHYTWVGRGTTLRMACRIGFYVSSLAAVAAIILLWLVYPPVVCWSIRVSLFMLCCCHSICFLSFLAMLCLRACVRAA